LSPTPIQVFAAERRAIQIGDVEIEEPSVSDQHVLSAAGIFWRGEKPPIDRFNDCWAEAVIGAATRANTANISTRRIGALLCAATIDGDPDRVALRPIAWIRA